MKKTFAFFKSEAVLCISVVLAVISCFFVKPDLGYIQYIDFRTLSLLFCLMAVMCGFGEIGVFKIIAQNMLKTIRSARLLVLILTMLCFFFSMAITNDVALITFVPFTFTVFNMLGLEIKNKLLVKTVVMQTIAANLGSMLTPVGNPQNLYLHGISGLSLAEFFVTMLPYSLASFVLLLLWALLQKNQPISINFSTDFKITDKNKLCIYFVLFVLCLLTVAKILDYRITLLIVFAVLILTDLKMLFKVDYALLLTFTSLFVFIGNMGRIQSFSCYIKAVIDSHECITAILASQIISNVPAALLLSGFTDNIKELIVGVNLGGLGTLIASMASLISFKYIVKENKSLSLKYLIYFTLANVLFLIILFLIYLV